MDLVQVPELSTEAGGRQRFFIQQTSQQKKKKTAQLLRGRSHTAKTIMVILPDDKRLWEKAAAEGKGHEGRIHTSHPEFCSTTMEA